MKKRSRKRRRAEDLDTTRSEYDFSGGVRGITAARYRQGTNLVLVDPALLDVFPDGEAVNDALHALAKVIRRVRDKRSA